MLLDQDRSRWNQMLIQRGLASLARAESLGNMGRYTLQAAIAACHARAATAADTDWHRIAAGTTRWRSSRPRRQARSESA